MKPNVFVARFPFAGLSVQSGTEANRVRLVRYVSYSRATRSCENVRSADTIYGRLRGGSRPGWEDVGPIYENI